MQKKQTDDTVYIHNHGHPGQNSKYIVNILPELPFDDVDLVVLMIGTNDALNSSTLTSFEEYEMNMTKIIKTVQLKNYLLVTTLLPFSKADLLIRHNEEAYGEFSPEERLNWSNTILKRLSIKYKFPLIDLNASFRANGKIGQTKDSLLRNKVNSNTQDGIHPTLDGYKLIASHIFSSIIKNDLPNNHIMCLGDSITYGVHMEGEGTSEGDHYPGQLRVLLESNQ